MAVVKSLTAVTIFFLLYSLRDYWYPSISSAVCVLVIGGISWFLARRVCHYVVLPHLMPRVSGRDKAVLITGCDSGFGHMLARTLNNAGFFVFAGCLNTQSDGSQQLINSCSNKSRLKVLQLDVTKQTDVDAAGKSVRDFLSNNGQGIRVLHAIVNNAGVAGGAHIEWSDSSSVADYERVLDVNLLGMIRVTRKFLPLIRASRGRIVNLSSILARTSIRGLSVYCVSKAAAAKFSEGLMSEMGSFGVQVIDVNPWFYKTPMLSPDRIIPGMRRAWDSADEEVRRAYGGEEYFRRLADDCVFTVTDPRNVCQDAMDVVHAMHEAVASYEPDTVTRVVSPGIGLAFWIINDFLPYDLQVHVRRLVDRIPSIISMGKSC